VLIGVVALVLTGLGVYFAAADTNPRGISENALALHGRVATTARLAFSIDTGGTSEVTGTLNLDIKNDELAGTISVPSVFSVTHYSVVLTDGHVYLGVPSLVSLLTTPWVSIPSPTPDLFPYGLELSKVKLDLPFLFALGRHHSSHDGPLTTYTITRAHVPLKLPASLPLSLPRSVSITTAITTASAGQLASAVATVSGRHLYFRLTVRVLSYDQPVHISAPPSNEVRPLTNQLRHLVLGRSSSPLSQLLSPAGLAALGQIRVN
jgi:hypothetical protein